MTEKHVNVDIVLRRPRSLMKQNLDIDQTTRDHLKISGFSDTYSFH